MHVRTRRLTFEYVQIFPIGSDAKEPVKATWTIQGWHTTIRASQWEWTGGRLQPSSPVKVSGSFLQKPSAMSFKGVALPSRDDVKSSLNLKEQHVTEQATVYCQ